MEDNQRYVNDKLVEKMMKLEEENETLKKELENEKKNVAIFLNRKPKKKIDTELPLFPRAKSKKAFDELVEEHDLKNRIVSTFDMSSEIKEYFSKDRNSKKQKYKAIIKFYSQSDTYEKYPYYCYFIDDYIKAYREING